LIESFLCFVCVHTPDCNPSNDLVGTDDGNRPGETHLGDDAGVRMEEVTGVGADGIRPDGIRPDEFHQRDQGAYHAPLRRAARSLSTFVGGFKAAVTSRAGRELNMSGIWQRNYYEHIIRNEDDLRRIEEYIQNNSERWEQDQLHPQASPNIFNQDKAHGG
jgi:hypothetical protein